LVSFIVSLADCTQCSLSDLLISFKIFLVQRERDKKLAEGMQEVSHTDLSGFYKKNDGITPGWEKKISRRSKKEQSKKDLKKVYLHH